MSNQLDKDGTHDPQPPIFSILSSAQRSFYEKRYRDGKSYADVASESHFPDPVVVVNLERMMLRSLRRPPVSTTLPAEVS